MHAKLFESGIGRGSYMPVVYFHAVGDELGKATLLFGRLWQFPCRLVDDQIDVAAVLDTGLRVFG